MTRRPGRDFPLDAPYQPGEVPPQMTVAQLTAVRDATASVTGEPGVHAFDDFVIYNSVGFRRHMEVEGPRPREPNPAPLGTEGASGRR